MIRTPARPPRSRRRHQPRALRVESLENRRLLASDIELTGDMKVRLEYVNSSGAVATSLLVGENYTMRALVTDRRASPTGIQQAYLHFDYNDLISVQSNAVPSPIYSITPSGDGLSTPGRIAAAGGITAERPRVPGAEQLLFTITVQPTMAGTLDFDLAMVGGTRDPAFFDSFGAIPLSEIDLECDTIEIVSAGVAFSRTSGLSVSETRTSTTVTVTLTRQPSSNVSFTLASGSNNEATVSSSSLQFTSGNWNVPQTITITGVDDFIDDGDAPFTIVTGNLVSTDPQFSGVVIADLTGTNVDNDTAGITVAAASGLRTTEAGGAATFTVRLDSQPTGDVTIPLRSGNAAEATVSPTSLVFTAANWNVAQTVTARGVNDDIDDDDVTYQIITDAATSSDSNYSGRNAADVSIVNADDDTAGFTFTPPGGLVTTEAGGTATFTVRLNSRPTADVRLPLSVSVPGEATLSPPELTFSTANWNTPQTITLTGRDDDSVDGSVAYFVVTAPAISSDGKYAGLNPPDLAASNGDNDVAGITVTAAPNLRTTEAGGTATFTIVLTSRPGGNVSIGLTSSDTTEGTPTVPNVEFTSSNWNVPQTVIVRGVNDSIDDGDVPYTIQTATAVSTDPNYNNLPVADVSLTNEDDDSASIIVTAAANLQTTEAGGTATFTIALSTPPNSGVTIGLSSSNTAEATVSPASVTFTPMNWNTPQTVTVRGIDDAVDDGDVPVSIITSATSSLDATYNNLAVADVVVTNVDNDAAMILVDPVAGLITTEAGTTAEVRVSLSSRPTANVRIPVRSSNVSEVTIVRSELVFTPENWNVIQAITLTGVDDEVDDDDVMAMIVTDPAQSTDLSYNGLDAFDATVTNRDDDTAGIFVSPTTRLETSEFGDAATFTIVLTSQPTSPVTIGVTSSNVDEGTVDRGSVTFTPLNWNVEQTITVTGVDDTTDDGDVDYTVRLAAAMSDDPKYAGRDAADVLVTNVDDDVPGIAVIPSRGLLVTEAGGTATFEVVLTTMPDSEVTIGLSSSNTAEGRVELPGGATSLVFTPANWNVRQLVMVRGIDDAVVDGNQPFTIVTAAAVSEDPVFSGINPTDVLGTNQDNDSATLTVGSVSVVEGTSSAVTVMQFTVTLSAAIASPLSVDIATADGSATSADYVSRSATLSFAGTSGETQTFTVDIVADAIVEPAETILVALSNLTGVPPTLAQRITLPASPSTGTITNDDTTTVTIVGPADVNEGDPPAETPLVFSVRSSGAVQGGFAIAYATDDGTATLADSDYVAGDGVLQFSGEANQSLAITVLGRGDEKVELDETLTVRLGVISGAAAGLTEFILLDNPAATATLINDDVARLILTNTTASPVEGTSGTVTEFRFDVRLTGEVFDADGFTVPFQVSDGTATVADGDYQANSGSLSFSGTAGETRTIVVRVTADAIVESDETFTVSLGAITGLDPSQSVLVSSGSLTATIQDDDTATLTLSTPTAAQNEGTEFPITVTLSAAVAGGLTIDFTTVDAAATVAGNDYTAATGTLSFDGLAGETRTFTVRSTADNRVERDESLAVSLRNLTAALTDRVSVGNDLALTIRNDDTATIRLIAPTSIVEGTSAVGPDALFEVVLSAPIEGGVTVEFATIDGTANSPSDYASRSGTLTFAGDALMQTIRVPVVADSVVERSETFDFRLGPIGGLAAELSSAVTLVDARATVAITNDDSASLSIVGPAPTNEGTGGSTSDFVFTVTLDGGVQGGFAVAVNATDDTAMAADGDYAAPTSPQVFAGTPGEVQTIRVPVNRDGRVEADETFRLALGQLSAIDESLLELISVPTAPLTATILNDDSATVGFATSSVQVLEADGSLSVPVRLSVTGGGSIVAPVTVNVVVRSTSTASPGDYVLSTTSVTFAAGSVDGTIQNVGITLTQDEQVEDVETIVLGLELAGQASPAISLGSIVTQTVTVVDDAMDAVLSGRVWVDANDDGVISVGETTLTRVTIRLTGRTVSGETIDRTTQTDQTGFYRFTGLASGTYAISQVHPSGWIDGKEVKGTVAGRTTGTMTNDRFSEIVVRSSEVGRNFNFGERGATAPLVNQIRFLARPHDGPLIGPPLTQAMLDAAAVDAALRA